MLVDLDLLAFERGRRADERAIAGTATQVAAGGEEGQG